MARFLNFAAAVVFLPEQEGGRRIPPTIHDTSYRPHVVVQDSNIRQAKRDSDGTVRENYLAVQFLDGPNEIEFGEEYQFKIAAVFSGPNYDELGIGEMFTIREGAKIVGYGKILGINQTNKGVGAKKGDAAH